jgi:hypothetical protein
MASKMSVSEEIYTHEYLWRMASSVLAEAKVQGNKADYFTLTALLMAYTAFEAFVNFCGFILFPNLWANERTYFSGKNSGIEAKLSKLQEKLPEFDWQKGKRPYQTIRQLKKLRDSMVHGKVIASRYETTPCDDGMDIKWKLSWNTFVSVKQAEGSMNDIKTFCQALLDAMREQSDHPHLNFKAFEGSLGSAVGRGLSQS